MFCSSCDVFRIKDASIHLCPQTDACGCFYFEINCTDARFKHFSLMNKISCVLDYYTVFNFFSVLGAKWTYSGKFQNVFYCLIIICCFLTPKQTN